MQPFLIPLILGNSKMNYDNNNNAEVDEKLCENHNSIQDFYKDAYILVTGGTGFVGKVLIEKLLRSCDGVKSITILMRPKRGMTVDDRLRELQKGQVSPHLILKRFCLIIRSGKIAL